MSLPRFTTGVFNQVRAASAEEPGSRANQNPGMVRLQKFLAEAGIASRRASEKIILEGRVSVNGQMVQELGTKVDPAQDHVAVDGTPVKIRRKIYVALNKPKGYLSSRRDPEDRRIITELLPVQWRHLNTVGRLDRDTEGLIFLTNDGQFALRLTHPRYGVRKTYHVTVEGRVEPVLLEKFTRGVVDEGERLRASKARILSANNTRSIIELELTEGKKREIRRLCAALGLVVLRLQRTRIGAIRLGELPVGKWRALTDPEIKTLLSTL